MKKPFLTIDGSMGEGGGQILRSSLTLSLVTGTPFRIEGIRAGRKKPGILRQHLTAVNAATEVGKATVNGGGIGSTELSFSPRTVDAGDYHFAVGTAGSATLVLQTVLPALLTASRPSTLVLEGGTHNPFAPPFDFLEKVYVPLVRRMGPRLELTLERHGFYPAGGGRFRVGVEPVERLTPLELHERGAVKGRRARALVANLPRGVAEREIKTVQKKLSWEPKDLDVEEIKSSPGPGNVLSIELEMEHLTEVFTSFGQLGVNAETVASKAVRETRGYLLSSAPVGEYLADQLLVPLALAGGGSFRATTLSRHTKTNIEVLKMFLHLDIDVTRHDRNDWQVDVKRKDNHR